MKKLLLILITAAGIAVLFKCGMFPKSGDDDAGAQNVPSDWDGLSDYAQSDWTVDD